MTKIVHFNVGGMRYDVAEDTLMKYEDTMLAKMVSEKWHKENGQEPLFIDSNGERFQYILDWYRNGRIDLPKTISVDAIRNEASFFGLPENVVIEESHSVDHYASSLLDTVHRLRRLRSNLAKMAKRNEIEAFGVWAVSQMLDETTLTGIPSAIRIPLSSYKLLQPRFQIRFTEKDRLLVAMKEIFATIGDEPHPVFLTSLELRSTVGYFEVDPMELNNISLILNFSWV